jgi:tRNA (guanine-N7-)-methyltransferase
LPEGDQPVKLDDVVPGEGPFEIEIGPGRGGFVFERCEADPQVRLLGLEIRLKWAHLVDERLKAAGLGGRARVLAGDAKAGLARLEPAGTVRTVFLHFPDPWWKKRHEKRLVMGDVLLDEVARLLAPGGHLYVQTDVEERAEQYAAQVSSHPAFEPAGDAPGSFVMAENPYGARSPREHHAIRDGLPVHRLRWARKA